jgi:hypothetical protein
MRYSYPRKSTRPLPRAELAPVGPAPPPPPAERMPLEEAKALARTGEDDIVTMIRCPLCKACGLVTPEVAVAFETLCATIEERR